MIELQQVHLSRAESVCGSTRERLIDSEGYHLVYRPELAAVVVTKIPRNHKPGDRMVQALIPWHEVKSAVPKKPVLTDNPLLGPIDKEFLERNIANGTEAAEIAEQKMAEDLAEQRRQTLAKNREQRWKGK